MKKTVILFVFLVGCGDHGSSFMYFAEPGETPKTIESPQVVLPEVVPSPTPIPTPNPPAHLDFLDTSIPCIGEGEEVLASVKVTDAFDNPLENQIVALKNDKFVSTPQTVTTNALGMADVLIKTKIVDQYSLLEQVTATIANLSAKKLVRITKNKFLEYLDYTTADKYFYGSMGIAIPSPYYYLDVPIQVLVRGRCDSVVEGEKVTFMRSEAINACPNIMNWPSEALIGSLTTGSDGTANGTMRLNVYEYVDKFTVANRVHATINRGNQLTFFVGPPECQ